VRFVHVKSGLSRHVVRFVASGEDRFAVKETTVEIGRREFLNYSEVARRGIPTLTPVGVVVRDEGARTVRTRIGMQRQEVQTAYLVTRLMEKVIPDSFLFKRAFSRENRRRIWNAVIDLFVQLHANGIYWGDASLANMLIQFSTEHVPEVGHRTRLQAVLADAETVEIRSSLSERLRLADVELFLESMLWTEADVVASGVVRDPMLTQADQEYIIRHYRERYALDEEMRSFELLTHIDVDRVLGTFEFEGTGKLLLQHIQEHKWYLSERGGREVPLTTAAEDWYSRVFRPVCGVFHEHGMMDLFPERTAATLYVAIMEHKYFMSEREHRDVGLVPALEDYATRFSTHRKAPSVIGAIVGALTSLFRGDPWAHQDSWAR